LIKSLLGDDEDLIYMKSKAFFEVFKDIPSAANCFELDSHELFSVVANKLKDIDSKDNLKLESILFNVLLRIVQRG
jgi:hypothetical protein